MSELTSDAEIEMIRRRLRSAEKAIESLRAALTLFIQTVNPPYPQNMALWQEHLKAATENAIRALKDKP